MNKSLLNRATVALLPAALVLAPIGVVGASGTGLSYQWYFKGTAIGGATGSSLVLNGVSLTQAGGYRAAVSNQVGSAWSREALLTVLERYVTAALMLGAALGGIFLGALGDRIGRSRA